MSGEVAIFYPNKILEKPIAVAMVNWFELEDSWPKIEHGTTTHYFEGVIQQVFLLAISHPPKFLQKIGNT